MDDDRLREVAVARAAYGLIPEGLQHELSLSSAFQERAGLTQTTRITFGPDGPTVEAARLLEVVCQLHAGGARAKLQDLEGNSWTVALTLEGAEAILSRNSRKFSFKLAYAVSPSGDLRVRSFRDDADFADFMAGEAAEWRRRLEERALTDDEVLELDRELRSGPRRIAAELHGLLRQPSVTPRTLVPGERTYYERLIGGPGESVDVIAFLEGPASDVVQRRLQAGTDEGLASVLLLSAHPQAARALQKAVLARHGHVPPPDPFSRVGYIEYLATSAPPDRREVLARTRELLDGGEDFTAHCELVSALFMMVEAEFMRVGLFDEEPPFWRRLAALAHAAVLFRLMEPPFRQDASFREFLVEHSQLAFALTTILDMRREPRWWPSYGTGRQFRTELLGRIYAALTLLLQEDDPDNAAIEAERDALLRELDAPSLFMLLPGPCEGGIAPTAELDANLRASIEEGLRAEPPSVEALHQVFVHSLVFNPDLELARLAANALQRMAEKGHDPTAIAPVASLLPQLAGVAAVSRDSDLADQVRVLCRVARRQDPPQIKPSSEFEACVMAAAARVEPASYASALSEWLEELCHGPLPRADASHIARCLKLIGYREPTLWPSVAPAYNLAELVHRRDAP